ncbi:MAG TPA: protein-L-isoaspartate(D-aspartate) O-methyltransferase [Tepidisphaeraceae bacterium]|nr:protein-L-isoaspartate(D-aspartate) O-methyltransferase [Tepidisphaeraceae bacterium]
MNQLEELSPLERMIRQQLMDRGIRDPRVLDAMRAVPRDQFMPRELREKAYADGAAPIGHGQTISQPYIVALMSQRLDVQANHRVLEIGTGTGYQTAVLAQLAKEVYTIERIKPLLDEAFERLLSRGYKNVHFRHADGTLGWPGIGTFDRILITAGAPTLPEKMLRDQLADGGLALLPIGPMESQMLTEVQRYGDRLETVDVCPVRFVKLIGTEGWSETEGG